MKTHKIILLAVLLLAFQSGFAQKRYIKKGDKQYFGYNYAKAVKFYEAVDNKDIDLERILADCYQKLEIYNNARVLYERILNRPERNFDDVWNYFLVLQKLEEYELANQQLRLLTDLKPSDSRVLAYVADTAYFTKLKGAEPLFEIKNLKLNNKQQDFGPVFFKEEIVFASSRNRMGFISRIWNGNSLPFLNIVKARIDYDDELIKDKHFYKKLNKKYHDGPVSFNEDFTVMAITRNNYKSKSADGTRKLQIFISEFINNKWTDPVSFPYNNPEYSVGQASLTPNGRYMYFVSDMPGGKGGTDIYKIERRKDGTWGKLINIENINTEGDEMFPYYHNSGTLFFASNGHPGLGGLDLFATNATDDSYSVVKNLGVPVNSCRDDFAMTFDKDLKKAYFTSNRSDGKGSDDIYFAKALKPITLRKLIRGVSKDKQDIIVPQAMVKLLYNDLVVDSTLSDSLGKYEFPVEIFGLYTLTGEKEGYIGDDTIANTDVPEEIIYADLILDRLPVFALHIKVTEKVSGKPVEGVKVTLVNKISGTEEVLLTSADGDYGRALENVSINDSLKYHLKYQKEGYFSVYADFNELIDKEGTYYIREQLVRYEDLKVGDDLGKYFAINMIFFDLDKYNIRPDAAIELDKIVSIMNQYPTMVIELGSHTDCRASYAYNIRLSQNRAKSSAAYIKQRITKPERIYGKGYGETKLVNECECEGKVIVPCTDEQHQLNRRTEFVIVKL